MAPTLPQLGKSVRCVPPEEAHGSPTLAQVAPEVPSRTHVVQREKAPTRGLLGEDVRGVLRSPVKDELAALGKLGPLRWQSSAFFFDIADVFDVEIQFRPETHGLAIGHHLVATLVLPLIGACRVATGSIYRRIVWSPTCLVGRGVIGSRRSRLPPCDGTAAHPYNG